LLSLSQLLSSAGLPAESLVAAQAAPDLLRAVPPPAAEQPAHLNLLAGSLFTLAQRLIEARRAGEASAPALEAVRVYRQAATRGAEVAGVVSALLSLAQILTSAGLSAESASAAQAARDLAP
jgi:hypothetical protein